MATEKKAATEIYENGYVLSGGAYRAVGQLGMLKALEAYGIRPDIMCGTSSGAIVAVLYASGYSPDEIFEIWQEEPFIQVFHLHLPDLGFLKSSKTGDLLRPYLKFQRLEELPVPTYVTCTCMNDGQQKVFREGDIQQILAGTCAVPVLFEPVEIGGRQYVDGGLVSNLPVEPLESRCRRIIGLHVNPIPEKEHIEGLTEMIYRTVWIGLNSTVYKTIPLFDWFISPEELGEHGLTERSAIGTYFNVGYEFTCRFLAEKRLQKT